MVREIVKYNNKLNTVAFKNFSDTELKIFFAILTKLKDQGTDDVTFSFDQLKELTGEKKHYTIKGYAELVQEMYSKLIHLSFKYDDNEDIAGEFNIFQGYERSLGEQTFTISMSPKFVYLLNELANNFTRFELAEFVGLSGKYPKLLYRQLKQWRMVGTCSFDIQDFRDLMDIPEGYGNAEVTRRVIDPSIKKLQKLDSMKDLRYEYKYRGKYINKVVFHWTPESIKKGKDEINKVKDFPQQSIDEWFGDISNDVLESLLPGDSKNKGDEYDINPFDFLVNKQNGIPLCEADKKVINWILKNTRMEQAAINIFVENILNSSQNRLVMSYVQMKAGEWARDGVVTRDQAEKETKKTVAYHNFRNKADIIPAYYDSPEIKEDSVDEQSAQEAMEFLKSLGKNKKSK